MNVSNRAGAGCNCYTIYENNEKYWNEIIKQFLKDDNCGNIRSTK